MGYRLRKWAARNRSFVQIATVVVSIVVACGVYGGTASSSARRHQQRAAVATSWANQLESMFLESLDRLAPYSEGYTPARKDPEFLQSITDQIAVASGDSHAQSAIALKHQLARANKVAAIWMSYGEFDRARELLESQTSLGKHQGVELSIAECLLGRCRFEVGDRLAGIRITERALREAVAQNGGELNRELWIYQSLLAALVYKNGNLDNVIELCERSLRRVPSDEVKARRNFEHLLAQSYCSQERFDDAIRMCRASYEEPVESLPDDLCRIVSGSNLVSTLTLAGRHKESQSLVVELTALSRARFGDQHPQTLTFRRHAAISTFYLVGHHEGLQAMREVVDDATRFVGADHELALNFAADLGLLQLSDNQFVQAVATIQQSMPDRKRVFGKSHPSTIKALNTLGFAQAALQQSEAAYATLVDAYARGRVVYRSDPAPLAKTVIPLVGMMMQTGRRSEAVALMRQLVTDCSRSLGSGHRSTRRFRFLLARLLFFHGYVSSCEKLCRRNLETIEPGNVVTSQTQMLLAECLVSTSRFEEAIAPLTSVLADKSLEAGPHRFLANDAKLLRADIALQQGDKSTAVTMLSSVDESLLWPRYHGYMRALGVASKSENGLSADVENELTRAFESLKAKNQSIHEYVWQLSRIPRIASRVCSERGQDAAATRWENTARGVESELAEFSRGHRELIADF